MTDRCNREVTQMLHCSQCSGFPCARPCQTYCRIVTSKCLELLYTDLNEFVKVAEKLEGPFNIENVVDPIEVKISEAIMNFQSNFDTLSKQIFTECGEPEQREDRRRRRSLNGTEIASTDKKSRKKPKDKSEDPRRLDHLVRDIRSAVQKTKFFWKSLVNITCDSLLATNESVTTTCWNGSHLVSTGTVTSLSVSLPLPDVDFSSTTVVEQQIAQLRAISVKLKMAVSGMDANWIDSSVVGYEDGSGSGSGDSENDDEEEDIEEEEEEKEEGSQSLLTFDEESRDHNQKSLTKSVTFTIDASSSSSSKHNHPFVVFVGCQPVTHSAIVLVLVLLPSWLI